MEAVGENSIARHAFSEQRLSKLTWYQKINDVLLSAGILETSPAMDIVKRLRTLFNEVWKQAVENSPKLRFYMKCKENLELGIGYEPYLSIKNHQDRRCLIQLRTSSHRLKIETGRYNQHLNAAPLDCESLCHRRCDFCTTKSVELLSVLPYADTPIIEDERHVL